MDALVRVSVTEVRNALRCPRIFALGRLRRSAVAFPVGSSCLGGAFHRIVDRFAKTVGQAPEFIHALAPDAGPAARCDALEHWILDLLRDEIIADPSYRDIPAEVDDLAEALRQFAAYLAERLPGGPLAVTITEVVQSGERPIEAVLPEAGVLLSGRIDAVHAGPGDRLDVVEYKLTDEENLAMDRAQVALYREALRRADGISATPVILRFNPSLSVLALDEPRSDDLLREQLVPLLRRMAGWARDPETAPATERRAICAACPVAVACAEQFPERLPARDDPPMAAARLRPTSDGGVKRSAPVQPDAGSGADADGHSEAAAIQRRILDELRRSGVGATSPDPSVGPTVYVISVALPRGSIAQLDRVAPDVEHRLANDGVDVKFVKTGARREFTVKRGRPRPVMLASLLDAKRAWLAERPGRLVVGQCPDGEILTCDLSDPATPHLLVAGNSGSGKSWLLKSIVASLIHFHDPAELRVTLLDPKRVTFNTAGFQAAIASHLEGPLLYGTDDALPCLERFAEMMDERYALFEAAQVADLHEYNQANPRARVARHAVVIDEFGDLTADKKAAERFCMLVGRLGAKARAAGIHLILATQRPDQKTVPSNLKANLGGKIALRVSSSMNSRIILDQSGAEALLGKGDLLADLGRGIVRAQAAIAGG